MTKQIKDENMDKRGHPISGKRLNIARNLKKIQLKDLAPNFKVSHLTIAKWQHRGIPKKSLSMVANYFLVEEWVFYDKNINRNTFKEIINDPKLIEKYRPVNRVTDKSPSLIFKFKGDFHKDKSQIQQSDSFLVSTDSVLIHASFWSADVPSIWVALVDKDKESKNRGGLKGSALVPHNPDMYVHHTKSKDSVEKISEQQFFPRIQPGHYYLNVASRYRFEVLVYEIKKYPNT